MTESVDELVRRAGLRAALPARHVAGLILTYRCSIRCRHCLFCCSPSAPSAVMTVEQAVEAILQLRALGRVVHIAGGEALLYPHIVTEAAREAHRRGQPAHFVETNAFWAVNDEFVRRRLEELKDAGLAGLLISADIFHQEFVPAENFLRARRIAREVFGPRNVLASDQPDEQILDLARRAGRDDQLAAEATAAGVRLVGRAAGLARYFPLRPIAQLADDPLWYGANDGMPCRREFDPQSMWEIHIDPYGNIQTCCGVLLGRLGDGPVARQAAAGWPGNPLVKTLIEQGPVGLLPLAQAHGYQPKEAYPQKCCLCYHLRHFLHPRFPDLLGPAEVYSEPPAE